MPNRWQQPLQQQMAVPQQTIPQQQQMLQQQFSPATPQQIVGLKGRIVSSIEEVKATPVDMDGSETYFPHPASNSIFTKSIDMSGNQVIRRYVLDKENGNQEINVNDLANRVKSLEEMLESLTGGTK